MCDIIFSFLACLINNSPVYTTCRTYFSTITSNLHSKIPHNISLKEQSFYWTHNNLKYRKFWKVSKFLPPTANYSVSRHNQFLLDNNCLKNLHLPRAFGFFHRKFKRMCVDDKFWVFRKHGEAGGESWVNRFLRLWK